MKYPVDTMTLIIKDAVTFERNRLGEPRTIKAEDFDAWLGAVEAEAVARAWHDGYRKGRQDGALFGESKGED